MNNSKQNRDREGAGEEPDEKIPLSYFITITCYGTWLHGDNRGSVDSEHNIHGTPFRSGDLQIKRLSQASMKQEPYRMNRPRRNVLKQSSIEVCDHRDWLLVALHVRSSHLHAVIHAKTKPERLRNDLKSYGSRRLNENGYDHQNRKRWARGGSGKYLWEVDKVQSAIRYTIHRQGEPLKRFLHPDLNVEPFREYDHQNAQRLRAFFQRHGILDKQGHIVQDKKRTNELRKKRREENEG